MSKKINFLNGEEFLKELKNMGNGPLTLMISCCKCSKIYELNRESVALAVLMKTTFIEYLKFIQNSKCPNCGESCKENE